MLSPILRSERSASPSVSLANFLCNSCLYGLCGSTTARDFGSCRYRPAALQRNGGTKDATMNCYALLGSVSYDSPCGSLSSRCICDDPSYICSCQSPLVSKPWGVHSFPRETGSRS
ncbi:hypothetical protein BS47DRAFT_958630 [Hydnum rufescens UP504]|uniref:Uncharacterized protein n=1 Tax=Hydnum rufescens UP504 TaxID=1448309 RepID=A0A9P6ABR7_9AGAM|nr:hypothetical protein BS47DRAFT_958630 [Hydnum rufescens UP504]